MHCIPARVETSVSCDPRAVAQEFEVAVCAILFAGKGEALAQSDEDVAAGRAVNVASVGVVRILDVIAEHVEVAAWIVLDTDVSIEQAQNRTGRNSRRGSETDRWVPKRIHYNSNTSRLSW